ncbi:alpha-ketoacid dehydrogenase subunit beta [Candidatus Woesearchaeota archaeon]|nr:alpha-ketoacid dehydrogenase subunit beta [Candidatus Woesearchaeota archaeon]
MPALTIVKTIAYTLAQEMKKDKRVIVLGEDVGKDGGVFRATEGLYDLFPDRVFDTPLAESGIVGTAIGLALYGFRPVAEIQFDGFSYPAIDQLISHAAKLRNRSRGRFSVPLVVRFPYGGGVKALEHHSDSPEAYFVHTPGLKVVVPSTPYEAKGLLLSAIRDPDPVIFMEPKKIYRSIKEEVPEEEYTIPLGKARIAKKGKDVSVFCWGAMVSEALKAAEGVKVDVEVVDLRTLSPLDTKTVLESAKKTGRIVIVHEAPRNCGVGAEIAAMISEKAMLNLKAPIMRVTGYDVPYPLPKLEDNYYPNAGRIIESIEKIARF